jgi:hypothetical protein
MTKTRNALLTFILVSLTSPLTSFASETTQDNLDSAKGIRATEVFGMDKGYIHPFMAVTFENSDNIYNTKTNTRNDWKAVYSPGIWLALPAQKEISLDLNTNNTSPGGHYQQMAKQEGFDRYQAYMLYAADIEEYHNYTDRNNVSQSGEAFFQLNLRSGLSFDVFDKYSDAEDAAGTGESTLIDAYKSNIAGIIADYQITEKLRVRADYSNYYLSYDKAINKGRDRSDNDYSLYAFYHYSPKTSFFSQYEYIDLSYDTNTIQDSTQHYVYLGMSWAPTVKTTIKGKAGWLERDTDFAGGNASEPVLELTVNWKMTVKSELELFTAQKVNESTIGSAAYSKDSTIRLIFEQSITDKIIANIFADYTKNNFQGGAGFNRTDNVYTVSPSIQYIFKEWLLGEAGYTWTERNSDEKFYDYTTSAFFVRVSAGI